MNFGVNTLGYILSLTFIQNVIILQGPKGVRMKTKIAGQKWEKEEEEEGGGGGGGGGNNTQQAFL